MSVTRYRTALVMMCALLAAAEAAAQAPAPAWSRGLQILPVKVSEASRRAEAALRAEGYTITNHSNPSEDAFFLGGQKANHSAIIMCDLAPGGQTWVNVVVASAGTSDNGVPGLERERLQRRMNDTAPAPTPPPAPPPAPSTSAPPPPPAPAPPPPSAPAPAPPSATCACGTSVPYCVSVAPGANAAGEPGMFVHFGTPVPRVGGALGVPDWLGLFRAGTKTDYVSWQRNEGLCPLFFNVVTPGSYELRYLEGSGYDIVRASTPVTITSDGRVASGTTGLAQTRGLPAPPRPVRMAATWTTTPDAYRGRNGLRITYTLPPNGTRRHRLYGTDIYTDDSTIGAAAVHAGLITYERGGTVTIEIRPGQAGYARSTRNGVTSDPTTAHPGSFVFVR